MKKTLLLWPPLFSAFLVAIFCIWALAQHGTMGMLRMNDAPRLACIAIGLAVVAVVIAGVLGMLLKSKGRVRLGRFIAVIAFAASLPYLFGVPIAFAVLGGVIQPNIGDTPPQLFITSGTGVHGIPDLAVTFNTAKATQNTIVWGKPTDVDKEVAVIESTPTRTHAFLLPDLEPDTDYYYRLEDGESYTFHTAAINGPMRFAIGSDAHYGSAARQVDASRAMLSQIADPRNTFNYFFLIGDTVQWGFLKSHWSEAFSELAQASAVVPSRLIPGNHDTMFSGFGNYLRYAYPDGLPLGNGNKLWTRLDVGHVHFIIIDMEWSAEAFTDEQAAWLERELRDVPAGDWKIVLSHGFTYASGVESDDWRRHDNPETIARLTPLFEKYQVDMVFSGHNHQMEILAKSGVTYVLSAPFGGVPSATRTYVSPYSLWYESGQYGFADVTITGDEAVVIIRTSDGSEIHRHNVTKGGSLS